MNLLFSFLILVSSAQRDSKTHGAFPVKTLGNLNLFYYQKQNKINNVGFLIAQCEATCKAKFADPFDCFEGCYSKVFANEYFWT